MPTSRDTFRKILVRSIWIGVGFELLVNAAFWFVPMPDLVADTLAMSQMPGIWLTFGPPERYRLSQSGAFVFNGVLIGVLALLVQLAFRALRREGRMSP